MLIYQSCCWTATPVSILRHFNQDFAYRSSNRMWYHLFLAKAKLHAGKCSLSVPHILKWVGRYNNVALLRIVYVCSMEMNKKSVKGIDYARNSLLVKVKCDLEMLPPPNYALELHIKWPNYPSKTWLQVDRAILNL